MASLDQQGCLLCLIVCAPGLICFQDHMLILKSPSPAGHSSRW